MFRGLNKRALSSMCFETVCTQGQWQIIPDTESGD